MPDEIETRLEALCRIVEGRLAGTLCAYKGFATPRLLPEEEGVECFLEIFFAPRGCSRLIMHMVHEDLRIIRQEHGASVAVVVHYTEDTYQYYLSDVFAIYRSRGIPLDFLSLPEATAFAIACSGSMPCPNGNFFAGPKLLSSVSRLSEGGQGRSLPLAPGPQPPVDSGRPSCRPEMHLCTNAA
jgi:hypothetical protein